MKNFLIVAALGAAIYFFFIKSPFQKDFYFNGQEYSHVKELSAGEVTNHFYSINGEDVKYARTFVQILEFSEHIKINDWDARIAPLLNRYNVKPFAKGSFEYTGIADVSGTFIQTFAAPIKVKDKDHMVLFINTIGTEKETLSRSEKRDILNNLKDIGNVFN